MFEHRIQCVIDRVNMLRHEVDDHWQIPADQAALLGQLVHAARCCSICEIGTSYGFSTLHLAAATARSDGHVDTFDVSERKTQAATGHLRDAGLLDRVTLHTGKAQQILPTLRPERPFDFVFLDAVKGECFAYLEAVMPHLADHAILVTDNTDTHWTELESFVRHLRALKVCTSCQVGVGNGFELTVRHAGSPA